MFYLKQITKLALSYFFRNTGVPIKVGGKFWIRFEAKYFRWFTASYEQDQFEALKDIRNTEGVVIDIGAHYGLYSLILAKYFNKKVFAFEPTPYSASILQRNIAYNKLEQKIDLHNCAVGRMNGEAHFMVQDTPGAVSNSLIDYWHSDEHKEAIVVKVVALDDYIKDPVSFIKIDAEGNEYDVLQGAKNTISKDRPIIFLGLHPNAVKSKGDSMEEIWDFIKGLEYDCTLRNSKISREEFVGHDDLFDVILVPNF